MRMQVKQKDLKEYCNVIQLEYCEGSYLLRGLEPIYYTTGLYGWRQDSYIINNNTIISTGYAPINSNYNNFSDYELTKKYNEKARKIWTNYDIPYEKRKEKATKLLDKFVKEIMKKRKQLNVL